MDNTLLAVTNPILGDLQIFSARGGEGSVGYFSGLLSLIVTVLITIGSLGLLFMLLIGAVGWIFSGGDKSKVEQARGRITTALTGFVILFAVWAVIALIERVFGIQLLSINLPSLLN